MTESVHFTTQDLAPLYRNSIGVDKLFDTLFSRNQSFNNAGNYPPYNIIAVTNDEYILELAIAGFTDNELNIKMHDSELIIRGEKQEEVDVHYIHNGIANRKFQRVFSLADYVEVIDAEINNGILVINLKRNVPDQMKPREIKIGKKIEPGTLFVEGIDPAFQETQ